MSELAILGGSKIRSKPFPKQVVIGEKEIDAVVEVLRSGTLSDFRGNWSQNFFGGRYVRQLEKTFAEYHRCAHAIAVNSCTSGLQVACGAVGLKPGDECIVSPYSMSCSATAPLVWNAVPIFCDIEEDTFCLNPSSVKERITPKTKAIIVVSLFGQPYDHRRINHLAKSYDIPVIEDSAQAIGSTFDFENPLNHKKSSQLAGTFGDIGVFSFTQGKHLTCGEGGMIITNNSKLAMKCRLIRNHAEAVINDMTDFDKMKYDGLDNNMLGFNMRMTEMQAAIIYEQIKFLEPIDQNRTERIQSTLEKFVERRRNNAKALYDGICSQVPAITPAKVREGCSHSYYVQPFNWNKELADGIHRDRFIEAVKAELVPDEGREKEGVPISCGYIKPLPNFPIFKNMRLYGGTNYPFSLNDGLQDCTNLKENYSNRSCPTAEYLYRNKLFLSLYHRCPLEQKDIDAIVQAFSKVYRCKEELR